MIENSKPRLTKRHSGQTQNVNIYSVRFSLQVKPEDDINILRLPPFPEDCERCGLETLYPEQAGYTFAVVGTHDSLSQ